MTNREFRQRLARLLDRQKKEAAAALKKPPAAVVDKVKSEKSA